MLICASTDFLSAEGQGVARSGDGYLTCHGIDHTRVARSARDWRVYAEINIVSPMINRSTSLLCRGKPQVTAELDRAPDLTPRCAHQQQLPRHLGTAAHAGAHVKYDRNHATGRQHGSTPTACTPLNTLPHSDHLRQACWCSCAPPHLTEWDLHTRHVRDVLLRFQAFWCTAVLWYPWMRSQVPPPPLMSLVTAAMHARLLRQCVCVPHAPQVAVSCPAL